MFSLAATTLSSKHSGAARPQRAPWRILVALILSPLPVATPMWAQGTVSAEYRSQANALAKLPSFVEWPRQAFASANDPFRVCVYGNFSFGTVLSEMTRSEQAHGRRVDIRWARLESDLRDCQIVFVSRSEQRNYAKILGQLHGSATLTVGETRDFAESGGMVELNYENGVTTFEINLAPTEEAHLRISSQLLSMARRVLRKTELAKS